MLLPLSLIYYPGFGSSAYPIFCGGAALLSRMLSASRAKEVVSRGECDAVNVSLSYGPLFVELVMLLCI